MEEKDREQEKMKKAEDGSREEETMEETSERTPEAKGPAPAAAETDAGREDELKAQLQAANTRLQELERERCLLLKGIPPDDVDYYAFKIGRLVTPERDFAAAAEAYLKEHGIRGTASGPRFSSGAALGAQSPRKETPADRMNELIRAARG